MLALDASGSVAGERLQHLIDAGSSLLTSLRNGDRAGLITFADRIRTPVPPTSDFQLVRSALRGVAGSGTTAVRDAIWAALQTLPADDGRLEQARPLVLVFSDGVDNASWLSQSALLEATRRVGIVVHAVELVGALPMPSMSVRSMANSRVRAPSFLEVLSGVSGGRSWSATSSKDLRELFTKAIEEMRARYLVTFYPEGPRKPGWHEVKIGVKGRGDVRARPGYFVMPRA